IRLAQSCSPIVQNFVGTKVSINPAVYGLSCTAVERELAGIILVFKVHTRGRGRANCTVSILRYLGDYKVRHLSLPWDEKPPQKSLRLWATISFSINRGKG